MTLSAVLTGDLIGSTEAPPGAVELAMSVVSECFGRQNGFTRFRGDGWQIHLDHAGHGLWAMLRIAAALRAAQGLESRIALGIGTAEDLDLANLSTARGSAFVASGRALAGLQKGARLAMAGVGLDALHCQLAPLMDERMSGWSREQAEAAAMAWSDFHHPTQQEIAERLGISRQAVAARLKSAGFAVLDMAQWQFFQKFTANTGQHHD